MIKVMIKDTGDPGASKYEATLENENFQNILDSFKDHCHIYFATYGRTKKSARNKMIKELKYIKKDVLKFADALREGVIE